MSKKALNTFWVVCQCLVLIIATGLSGGCNDDDNSKPQNVQGWVSAGRNAISAATLEIDNPDGKTIYGKDEPATTEFGSFTIAVHNLPADFRVVASNGYYLDQPFLADLSADYRNFDPETGIVYVNVVTTMVSAYLDKHPEATVDEATLTVMSFLEIPEGVDIHSGLSASGEYFDHYRFLQEAENNGGVNPYIDHLMAEMDGGPADVTHPFPALMGVGGGGGVGAWVAESIATGALSYVGGQTMGYGLKEIGLTFPDANAEALAEMKRDLVQIKNQLDDLSSQMGAFYLALSAQLTHTGYDIRIGQIEGLISNIMSIKSQLASFVSNPPTDGSLEAKRTELKNLIRDKLVANEYIIPNQLLGTNGQTPLLKLCSQIVKSRHRFLNKSDYNTVKTMFDYFEMLQAVQMELLVEYYHSLTPPGESSSADADRIIRLYEETITAQRALLLPPLPDSIYVYHNATYDLMIYLPDNYNSPLSVVSGDGPFGAECNCNVNIEYGGGMAGPAEWGVCKVWMMNWDHMYDVYDWSWRNPTIDEIKDIFLNWSGNASNPGEFARSQGLTPMASHRYIHAFQDPATCGTIDCESQWVCAQRWDDNYGAFHYNTTNGEFGWLKWTSFNSLDFMPVRVMGPEINKYFW